MGCYKVRFDDYCLAHYDDFKYFDYFEFNGKKYKVKGPSVIDCYKGQVVNLLINPNKPRDVYFRYSIRDNLFIHIFSFNKF